MDGTNKTLDPEEIEKPIVQEKKRKTAKASKNSKITEHFSPKQNEGSSKDSKEETDSEPEIPLPAGYLTPEKTPQKANQPPMDSQAATSQPEGGAKKDVTPTSHKVTGKGNKGKRGRKKKQSKQSQNLAKTDKKPQSPMMKKLSDFFPVRRSNRKCKSLIEAEEKKYVEDAIKLGKEEGIEMRDIAGKGRGVVAAKSFKKGQFVVEYHGDLIDVDHAKELEDKYSKDQSIGCYMYYFEFKSKRYCVDATKESDRLGRLLNHSKSGNCCTKLISFKDKPHLILVAKQDIKEGDELLYDYGDRNKDSLQSHPWLAL